MCIKKNKKIMPFLAFEKRVVTESIMLLDKKINIIIPNCPLLELICQIVLILVCGVNVKKMENSTFTHFLCFKWHK
jgi:hypothetical protein